MVEANKNPRAAPLALSVNGQTHTLLVEARTSLLEVLREQLDLTGAKPACERGECGACTVLLDGRPFNACHLLAVQTAGRSIVTVEGLGDWAEFQALREAFVACDGGQCGYCSPGFAVAASALLRETLAVDEQTIRWALVGHICRCNAYDAIVTAVREAGENLRR